MSSRPDQTNSAAKKPKRALMACRNCRKRKIKCLTNLDPPYEPCERCTRKGYTCEYISVSEDTPHSSPEPSHPGTSNVTQQMNPYPMYPRPPSQIVPPTVPYINTVPSMQQPYQSGAQLLPPSLSHSRSHPTAPQNYTYQQQTAAGWMPPPHPGHDPASLGWTHAQRQQTPSPSYPSQMASYNPNYPVPHYQQPGDHTTLGRYYDPNRQDFDASHTMQNRRHY